jgi:hypothetical protein
MAFFDLQASAGSNVRAPHFTIMALHAWGGITFRLWAWTTVVALILALTYVIGILPVVLNIVALQRGPSRPASFSVVPLAGVLVVYLAAGYCFLLTITIAEHGFSRTLPPIHRYVAAGTVACAVAVAIEIMLYLLFPSMGPGTKYLKWPVEMNQLLNMVTWSAISFGLSGGLVLAVYVRVRSARLAREAFNSAELERVAASRDVLSSQLAAMQARVEPQFLLGTLAQVEALYDRDPEGGDRMLDALIAYLRSALPQLRSGRSTLGREAELAESYLKIVQLRMGSRLNHAIDISPALGDSDFPPMMLLPLIDETLRSGLEPLPYGGTITVRADVDGDHLRVYVCDNGLPRAALSTESSTVAALRERLTGLYDETARLELTNNAPQGVVAMIEVPLGPARHHR